MKCLKTIPLTAAHTYIAHICHPPPRTQQFSFALFSRCHYYFVNNISNSTTHSSLRVIKQFHWKHFFRSVFFSFKWYATLKIQSDVDCLFSLNATLYYLMLFSRFVLNLIIVFSQQRKVLRLWCQELPVKTFWKVVTLRGMVSTGLTQQPQGTPLECIVTWLLMEVSSNHSHPLKPVENRELVLHETGQRHDKEYVTSLFPASSPKA